jgi:hypothetical protein
LLTPTTANFWNFENATILLNIVGSYGKPAEAASLSVLIFFVARCPSFAAAWGPLAASRLAGGLGEGDLTRFRVVPVVWVLEAAKGTSDWDTVPSALTWSSTIDGWTTASARKHEGTWSLDSVPSEMSTAAFITRDTGADIDAGGLEYMQIEDSSELVIYFKHAASVAPGWIQMDRGLVFKAEICSSTCSVT